jgi:hypothetical protein
MSDLTDIIALIFDFDDTLVPDSTTSLLESNGIDVANFWNSANSLVQNGYDQPLAYLKLLLDIIGDGRPLGKLTNDDLGRYGASLDGSFHEGLPEFFDDIRTDISKNYKGIKAEFYIVSGGLQAVIEGSAIVKKYFNGVYACQLAGENENGPLTHIKRCITFTEKTRYLFEINKGISQSESSTNPLLVNKYIAEEERRVPFENMIYVGDGLTDVPCFSLIQKMKGHAFGVFDPSKKEKTKQALEEFLEPKRVTSMHAPRFKEGSELGSMLRAAVTARCLDIHLKRKSAL